MPVRVQCGCGKSFQVVDALIGKNVRCPACSKMVPVPGGASPAAPAPTAGTAQARPKAAPKGTKYDAAAAARKPANAIPAFAISPKMVIFACALVGVPLLIALAKVGPIKAMDQWRDLEPKLRDYTHDVVRTVCMDQYKGVAFDEFVRPPSVTNVMIDSPIMMLVLPSEVYVQGTSTEGRFKGTYFTRDKRFEIDVTVEGDSRTIKVKSHVDEKGHPVIDEEK